MSKKTLSLRGVGGIIKLLRTLEAKQNEMNLAPLGVSVTEFPSSSSPRPYLGLETQTRPYPQFVQMLVLTVKKVIGKLEQKKNRKKEKKDSSRAREAD